jgi:hypothetical protein
MQRSIRPGIIKLLFTLLGLSWAQLSTAAVAVVGVGYFQLSPDPVYIKTGDYVYWSVTDQDFEPYSITGSWGTIFAPDAVLFSGAGTYHYTASSFYGGSWDGTVYVSSNNPPTVTITTPTNGTAITAPGNFAFQANAYDADPNDIWDVEFWVNSEMVDDVYDPPYATTVTNLAAGTYTLKAVVWDYSYAKATNTIVITVGNPGPITLTGSALSGGQFKFNASGLIAGKTNVLQSSTNLASLPGWIPLSTNIAVGATASFTNTLAPGPHFFRLIQLP